MHIRFFTIPIKNTAEPEAEVNRFLDRHRILAVDRRFVENGENSFWTLAVEHLTMTAEAESASGSTKPGKTKVDYKEILSDEDFAVFSRLREVRKAAADAEAVPVYAVLTTEQLAAMAKSRPSSLAELMKISGVGEAKAAKYGARLLDVLGAGAGDGA